MVDVGSKARSVDVEREDLGEVDVVGVCAEEGVGDRDRSVGRDGEVAGELSNQCDVVDAARRDAASDSLLVGVNARNVEVRE
ncbi:MAG TPA: hypothetical protein VN706_21010 [Gemmatimonadaceae bacterium]|nr:hypothetical protein [Gemmatimonadaceae bacterium]